MYRKLALQNIQNNKQYYLPYMISCIFMVMTFYTIYSLAMNPNIQEMMGGDEMQLMLRFGVIVIALFSIVFIFYINGFLMKQRTREFGLYNILGMEKKHINLIVFYETFIVSILCLIIGIGLGILLDKGLYLLILKVFSLEIQFGFYISIEGIYFSLLLFGIIFICAYLFSILRIQILNPIELLHQDQKGQKEPKNKWVFALIGFVCLIAGYVLSITVKDPISAFIFFFVAVILVVIGTYFLFTYGSITLLKFLQKNKSYYYKTSHFINVSNMKYRMSQNGIGLANICILSTMILVALSSTVSLWIGFKENLYAMYPYDICIRQYIDNDELQNVLKDYSKYYESKQEVDVLNFSAYRLDNSFILDQDKVDDIDYSNLFNLNFMDLETYEKYTGENIKLDKDEVLISEKDLKELKIETMSFKVKGKISAEMKPITVMTGLDTYDVVVDSRETLEALEKLNQDYYGNQASYIGKSICINLKEGVNKLEVENEIYETLRAKDIITSYEGKDIAAKYMLSIYAGFLFIGIFVSILFLIATVLIMYYKQISEGLQDKSRFEVMRKVGLDEMDIKRTVNSQVLTLFFLPLVMTGIHLAFAFPMIRKLLVLLQLTNTNLYIIVTCISFMIFAMVYIFMYIQTSRVYYRIVNS